MLIRYENRKNSLKKSLLYYILIYLIIFFRFGNELTRQIKSGKYQFFLIITQKNELLFFYDILKIDP